MSTREIIISHLDVTAAKKAAAKAALDFLSSNMNIGVGSGTTVRYLISYLNKSALRNLKIVPTSLDTKIHLQNSLAKSSHQIIDLPQFDLDITIDGADSVNPEKQAIKGGGGALTREKLVRNSSIQFILIVDESKVVPALGNFPVAVEILPFGWRRTIELLKKFGAVSLRQGTKKLGPVISDNFGYIVDIKLFSSDLSPNEIHNLELQINEIPGVIENGIFGNPADRVIVGKFSGEITGY